MEQILEYIRSSKIILSAIIVVGTLIITHILKKRVNKKLNNEKAMDGKKEINYRFFANIVKYLIYALAAVYLLEVNGVNVTSLVAGLGVAGIIVGFALQDGLKDLIMGINIVWGDFFDVGEVVKYNSIVGEVVYYNLKITRIRILENDNIVTISNRNISEIQRVSDWLDVSIPAPYEISAERMRQVCIRIRGMVEKINEVDSCEFIGTDEFCDSYINYKIRIHCSPQQMGPIRRMSLSIIQDVFAEEEIDIPYAQLDVHMV